MVRRALTRNLKTTPPDAALCEQYLLLWSQKALYEDPLQYPRLDSQALFGNAQPLALEVGCGTGEWLAAMAEAAPEVNFVGVEPWSKVAYRAVEEAAALGVRNVRIVRAPMQFLYPLLVPGSLAHVFIHYPDPNIRARGQHKIFNPAFLDALHEALSDEGTLHVVTDHDALLAEMLEIVEADPRWQRTHEAPFLVGYDPLVKSRYQRLWEKHDVPPKRFELRRRSAQTD